MSATALKSTKRRFSSLNHQNFEFFCLVPRSPTHTGLICGKTLEPHISSLGPFKSHLLKSTPVIPYCKSAQLQEPSQGAQPCPDLNSGQSYFRPNYNYLTWPHSQLCLIPLSKDAAVYFAMPHPLYPLGTPALQCSTLLSQVTIYLGSYAAPYSATPLPIWLLFSITLKLPCRSLLAFPLMTQLCSTELSVS